MKNVLVTGGTGFIGSNLAAYLLSKGYNVAILRRPESDLRNIGTLQVENRIGDIRDSDAVRKSLKGIDTVFHTAATISFWKPKRREMFSVNVEGTKNIVDACLRQNIERLVHTSSIAAIGHPAKDGELADETNTFNWFDHGNGYKLSKHLGEIEIQKGIQRGLFAVIVNPAVVIGPGDVHFNGGKIIRTVKKGLTPFNVKGGMNLAYVEDIVRGQLATAKYGRNGERYILGGHNLTHREIFRTVAEITGGFAPYFPLPLFAVKTTARIFDGIGFVLRREPYITSELISGAGLHNWYSSEKAMKELKYTITPVKEAIQKTYDWYCQEGLL